MVVCPAGGEAPLVCWAAAWQDQNVLKQHRKTVVREPEVELMPILRFYTREKSERGRNAQESQRFDRTLRDI
jgi:hypothetical protein